MLFIYGLGTNGPPCVKVFCYSANSELFRKIFIYNLSWESLELVISCFLKRAIYVCVIPSSRGLREKHCIQNPSKLVRLKIWLKLEASIEPLMISVLLLKFREGPIAGHQVSAITE